VPLEIFDANQYRAIRSMHAAETATSLLTRGEHSQGGAQRSEQYLIPSPQLFITERNALQ
jgi:hypothetical protein